jgi:hypothetical protein
MKKLQELSQKTGISVDTLKMVKRTERSVILQKRELNKTVDEVDSKRRQE